MIIAKERSKSDLLLGLQYLDAYMNLSDEHKRELINLEKGYKGEELFDRTVKKYLTSEFIVLNDLLLNYKGASFQIDSLIISNDSIHVYEVKNYSGEYKYSAGQFSTLSGHEITNPLNQLNRTVNMMRKIMRDWDITLELKAHIIFINPHFTLYNALHTDPIILPTNIDEHFNKLNNQSRSLDKIHHFIAGKLNQSHLEEVPFQRQLPDYKWDDMTKGLSCPNCFEFKVSLTQRKYSCRHCLSESELDHLIFDHIKKFCFLFPQEKLTVSALYTWLNGEITHHRIRKVLSKRLIPVGKTSGRTYTPKEG